MIAIVRGEDEILFSETDAKHKRPGIYVLQGNTLTKIGTFTDDARARQFRKVFESIYNANDTVTIRFT